MDQDNPPVSLPNGQVFSRNYVYHQVNLRCFLEMKEKKKKEEETKKDESKKLKSTNTKSEHILSSRYSGRSTVIRLKDLLENDRKANVRYNMGEDEQEYNVN